MSIAVLQKTRIGNTLSKCMKTLKRHKRTSTHNKKEALDDLIQSGEKLLEQWKKAADAESKRAQREEKEKEDKTEGLPETVKTYHSRLEKQKKEIYKDPPVLPPEHIIIEEERVDLPKRDKKTGQLTFVCGKDRSIKGGAFPLPSAALCRSLRLPLVRREGYSRFYLWSCCDRHWCRPYRIPSSNCVLKKSVIR